MIVRPDTLVVIPTVPGREHSLARTIKAYRTNSKYPLDFLIVPGRETCGEAWRFGTHYALLHDYPLVHFTADDLDPQPGWDTTSAAKLAHGYLPAPVILNGDGTTVQATGRLASDRDALEPDGTPVDFTGVPLLPSRFAYHLNVPDIHYFSDTWISYAARELFDTETVLDRRYVFHHWYAEAGAGAGYESRNDRANVDYHLFTQHFKDRFGHIPNKFVETSGVR